MGVPKFFRYISERYPCLSELVKDYQIPEFDNMYLDMNGIIHMCSHPDDNNPHFRISEEKIFKDIFHYLEVLFRMVQPQKLFFMAIDGVAPRAKMNQQRGRRYRTAKDSEKQELEALKKGDVLPTEAKFDSNCITPGTKFMDKLHQHLKYFVIDKISNDPLWRRVTVILSGHETPGEGEHKIMDYIRYIRAQPGYDPNTRHCLYGLDADLIMLGLCTHEPHFSLLREEVKFGKKSARKTSVPEEINFFLLHLSLMREYLELEFLPVKDKLVAFEYDFEQIIDDWVLMGFLIGNDFIPHLPNLHIVNGALPILYQAYMEVLPTLDGYINEAGTLNLPRFEKFMQKLADFDVQNFEEIRDDLLYMEAKTGRKCNAFPKTRKPLAQWNGDDGDVDVVLEVLEQEESTNFIDSGIAALIKETEDLFMSSSEEVDNEHDDDDEEDQAFENYKKEYYRTKLEYEKVTPEVLRNQAEGYVRAIQWNLNYYYNGVCSWSWFYPHHYAPYISDIKGFSDLKIEFDLGTPFKPYEQLLAVLPPASKTLLPAAYHHLMMEGSPLKHYYPNEFQTDMNGKRQEWEAVVLLPFMDEEQLIAAMKPCNEKLSVEEQKINTHRPMLVYTYTDDDFGRYEVSPYFPSIKHNHTKLIQLDRETIRLAKEKLIKGAYPGISSGIYYPGFPTMKHLKYKGVLQKAKVKVFDQASRGENMILKILPKESSDSDDIPVNFLRKTLFVGWPHLVEARVVAISNKTCTYVSMGDQNQYNVEDFENKGQFKALCSGVVDRYKTNLGVDVGAVKVACSVQLVIGRKYIFSPSGRLTLEKQFSEHSATYPLQTIVSDIEVFDEHNTLFKDALDVFHDGAICFTLCNPYYGSQGIVLDSRETIKRGRIKVCVNVTEEPEFNDVMKQHNKELWDFKPLSYAASQLGMGNFLYLRITSSIYISVRDGEGGLKNVNIGLELRFNKRSKETPGYTRRVGTTWYYSDKCTNLVREYSEKFPEIFKYFSHNENNDCISGERIFGDSCDEKIKELQTWLRNLPICSIERQACGSSILGSHTIELLETCIDNFLKSSHPKKVTMQVKPSLLFKFDLNLGHLMPDDKMTIELFDRIVNIRVGFSVPFGLKGTIIAIREAASKNDMDTMYDIVFDKPFKDGMNLNCSEERGYRLPKTSFINISHGKRLLEEKTGKQGSLLAMANSAKTQNSWRDNNPKKVKEFFKSDYQAGQDQSYQFINQPQFNKQGSAFASFNHHQAGMPIGAPQKESEHVTPNKKREANVSNSKQSNNDRTVNMLMPKFSQSGDDVTPKKIMTKADSMSKSLNQGVVNTDFLMNLLKIGTQENETVEPNNYPVRDINSIQVVPTKETSSNVSFEMLAEVAKAPATGRLLTYYQSNNLGIPRYQYFCTDGMIKAQITLQNGQIIVGKPAETREKATEYVAEDVLQILIKKATFSDINQKQPNDGLPNPPKTWVDVQRPSTKGTTNSHHPKDQALQTALHNPFVPTQVIKRQHTRISQSTSSAEETQSVSVKTEKPTDCENNLNITDPRCEEKLNKSQRKKRSRQSRIAAKFPVQS